MCIPVPLCAWNAGHNEPQFQYYCLFIKSCSPLQKLKYEVVYKCLITCVVACYTIPRPPALHGIYNTKLVRSSDRKSHSWLKGVFLCCKWIQCCWLCIRAVPGLFTISHDRIYVSVPVSCAASSVIWNVIELQNCQIIICSFELNWKCFVRHRLMISYSCGSVQVTGASGASPSEGSLRRHLCPRTTASPLYSEFSGHRTPNGWAEGCLRNNGDAGSLQSQCSLFNGLNGSLQRVLRRTFNSQGEGYI